VINVETFATVVVEDDVHLVAVECAHLREIPKLVTPAVAGSLVDITAVTRGGPVHLEAFAAVFVDDPVGNGSGSGGRPGTRRK
jgi:hypothetical protein